MTDGGTHTAEVDAYAGSVEAALLGGAGLLLIARRPAARWR